MSEEADPGAIVPLQDRIGQISNQLTSVRILIDKVQAALLEICAELAAKGEQRD
jgi:hypothetical protein